MKPSSPLGASSSPSPSNTSPTSSSDPSSPRVGSPEGPKTPPSLPLRFGRAIWRGYEAFLHATGSSPDGTDPGDIIDGDPADREALTPPPGGAPRQAPPDESWGAKLRYRLGLDEADSDGFTEAPANAWFTAAARQRREASTLAQGPWGVFASLSATTRGQRARVLLEVLLTVSVFSGMGALVLFPRLPFIPALGLAIWAGRVAFAQVPLLESLDDEEFIDLEAVTWEDLKADLVSWLGEKARAGEECADCTRIAKAELRGYTSPRLADMGLLAVSAELGMDRFNTGGDQDPLGLHPEGPVLERQEALRQLAWGLTQLAKRHGVGLDGGPLPTATLGEPERPPVGDEVWTHPASLVEAEEVADFRDRQKLLFPPQKMAPLWRGQALRQEAWSEISATVQESYGMDIDGGSLTPTPLIFGLRESITRRRLLPHGGRRWGPWALLWYPFRYASAIPRILAFEAAIGVIIVGLLMVAGGLTAPSLIGWCRGVFLGGLVMLLGTLAAAFCSAGIED